MAWWEDVDAESLEEAVQRDWDVCWALNLSNLKPTKLVPDVALHNSHGCKMQHLEFGRNLCNCGSNLCCAASLHPAFAWQ